MAGSGPVVLRDPDLDTQDDGGRAEVLRPPRPRPGTRHERLPRLGPANSLRQTLLASRTVLSVPAGNGQFTPGQGSFQGDGRRDGLSCRGRYRASIFRDKTVSPENGRSPGGIRLCSRVALGVREISRPLEFASSYTLIEHAPKEALLEEVFPQAVREIRALKQAWNEGRHHALVERIGGKSFDPDDEQVEDEQRAIEALLLADSTGEISRHPYVHYQLDKMLAKWAFKTLTGGGFTMPAFALADDGYLLYHA